MDFCVSFAVGLVWWVLGSPAHITAAPTLLPFLEEPLLLLLLLSPCAAFASLLRTGVTTTGFDCPGSVMVRYLLLFSPFPSGLAGLKVNQQESCWSGWWLQSCQKQRCSCGRSGPSLDLSSGGCSKSPKCPDYRWSHSGRFSTSPRAGNFTVERCNPVSHRIFWGLPDGLQLPTGAIGREKPLGLGVAESICEDTETLPCPGFAPFPFLSPRCSLGCALGSSESHPWESTRDNAAGQSRGLVTPQL